MSEQPDSGMPDLEEILRQFQGVTSDMTTAITTMAAVHAQWRQAWADTGKFTGEESFELVRIIVAAGFGGLRALG